MGVSEVGVGERRKVRRRAGIEKMLIWMRRWKRKESNGRLAFFGIFNLIPEGSEEGFD